MGFHQYSSGYDWARVAQYKQRARQVEGGLVDLSIGSPVDPVPQSVREALAQAANELNAYGYPVTVGTPDLKQAIDEWFRDCRHIDDLTAINAAVVPTVGSKEAVSLMASLLFLGEGDVVVQPRVSYPTYEIGTQLAGATVYKVDNVADTESWVHEPGVKAVWVNSPNNPTGEVLSVEQLHRIVEAARSINAIVLSDECYAMLDWDTQTRPAGDESFISSPCILRSEVCDSSAKNILMLYSLSKQSNMAGYRTAFIAGDAEIIATMADYRKQIGQIIPGPIQAAMAAGLRDRAAMREQYQRYHERLTVLVSALQDYGYAAHTPQGALYVWVPALSGDCWQDMEVLSEIGIVPSPGAFYGDSTAMRFSITASDHDIQEAAQRLHAAAVKS